MADGLENDGLRQRVAAARASAGAAGAPLHPTPPADELASFWVKPPQGVAAGAPPPPPIAAPIRVADRIKKKAAAGVPARKDGPPAIDGTRKERCTRIVDTLLQAWVKEQKQSTTKANSELARGLMRNGAALIHSEYPIDQLRSLVALTEGLITRAKDESDDKLLEETRKIRESLMITEESAPSDEEYEEEENREEAE